MSTNKRLILFGRAILTAGLMCLMAVVGVTRATTAKPDPYLRPIAVPVPADNAITPARVELGKMLFFDPRLSGSQWISCASCHNPALSWSDGLPTAIGDGMKKLPRRTPTILNVAYNTIFMWDGRAASLEDQATGPIKAKAEMDQDMTILVERLVAIPGYQAAFERAYPGEGITEKTIAKALASFERTIVSANAPFDRWHAGDKKAVDESAKRGFKLFTGKAKCDVCHEGFNFTDNGFHNIGLKTPKGMSEDVGRYTQRKVKVNKGAFKTPTLRDVALNGPYMHNGMYRTLEEVVDHYDRGGDVKDNLDPNMEALNLTPQEKQDLVAFLKSLTGAPLLVTIPQLPR
jgi:cytochrome c peroxidase